MIRRLMLVAALVGAPAVMVAQPLPIHAQQADTTKPKPKPVVHKHKKPKPAAKDTTKAAKDSTKK
ncbi:MAG TPA: hypothetical protein VN848_00210 [Gemmatimonadales bacterium]|nr:hypothetical protein [Gemmatimonadales bacterium]